MQDLGGGGGGGGGGGSTRNPHTFSKGFRGSAVSSPIGRFATFAIFKSQNIT